MEQAEQICDHVVLINKGRVLLDGPIAQVRATGGNTVQLDYEGDGNLVKNVRGVTRVNDAGKHAEFVLAPGTDPDEILKQLVGKVKVRRFDTREASLHEIFVRNVGSDITERGAPHA
jgi:ABC-2 type transport system ATP-binding protein